MKTISPLLEGGVNVASFDRFATSESECLMTSRKREAARRDLATVVRETRDEEKDINALRTVNMMVKTSPPFRQ